MTVKDCPSAPCAPGAKLHGFVGPDGRIIRLVKPVEVDQEFVDEANKCASPTRRFRFSSACVSGCGFWNGSGCNLAAKAMQLAIDQDVAGRLPRCSIRKTCRWYAQEGGTVCQTCSHVVTDVS